MAKMDKDGWCGVPGSANWKCPDCNKWTPFEEWREREVPCDECGDHDARVCPHCGAIFDHVWGSERISDAMWEEVEANFFG